jgi:hypothetical protein
VLCCIDLPARELKAQTASFSFTQGTIVDNGLSNPFAAVDGAGDAYVVDPTNNLC